MATTKANQSTDCPKKLQATDLRPLGDRVVIRPEEAPDKIGNILLPDDAKQKPSRGKVLAIGPGKLLEDGTRAPVEVCVDDVVMYSSYSGSNVEVEGEKLLIMNAADILAIWERA